MIVIFYGFFSTYTYSMDLTCFTMSDVPNVVFICSKINNILLTKIVGDEWFIIEFG